jgi:hypothetical protein
MEDAIDLPWRKHFLLRFNGECSLCSDYSNFRPTGRLTEHIARAIRHLRPSVAVAGPATH